jgi:hypothetical protein
VLCALVSEFAMNFFLLHFHLLACWQTSLKMEAASGPAGAEAAARAGTMCSGLRANVRRHRACPAFASLLQTRTVAGALWPCSQRGSYSEQV